MGRTNVGLFVEPLFEGVEIVIAAQEIVDHFIGIQRAAHRQDFLAILACRVRGHQAFLVERYGEILGDRK